MLPFCALAGLVVAQPFSLEARLEAETRGGRLPVAGDDRGIGAEFSLEPQLRAAYGFGHAPLGLDLSYSPRLFTRARGLGYEDILVLHNASFVGTWTQSPRLQLSLNLNGAHGEVDFSNATFQVGDLEESATEAVPDQSVIKYTRGRARIGARWQPTRAWLVDSRFSATVFRTGQEPSRDLPGFRDQHRFIWETAVERQLNRKTTTGGELEVSFRSFAANPIFAGVTAAGTLEQRLGPRTTVGARLGIHSYMRQLDDDWSSRPIGLPVCGVTAQHTIAVASTRRLTFEGRAELRPYADSVYKRVDDRFVVRADVELGLSTVFSVLAGGEWARLVPVWHSPKPGQDEQVINASGRFQYRVATPVVVNLGIRLASRMHRTDANLVTGREELVAFLTVILSADLLGD